MVGRMLAVGNFRGNTERVVWIKGSEGLMSQVGKMATVLGWSQTPEVGRWSREHGCLSAAGWLAYSLRSGSGPRCLAGRSRQEALGREREQAACPL